MTSSKQFATETPDLVEEFFLLLLGYWFEYSVRITPNYLTSDKFEVFSLIKHKLEDRVILGSIAHHLAREAAPPLIKSL